MPSPTLSFERLKFTEVYNLAKFIVSENYIHHQQTTSQSSIDTDIISIYNFEVKHYHDSFIYAVKDVYGGIIGSIRLLEWNYSTVLPIQTICNINPYDIALKYNPKNIYHIGRFAINKKASNVILLKKMMVCAIAPIMQNISNIGLAECDSKLLKVFSLLKIRAEIVGKSVDYLGSETIPIVLTYNGLIDFFELNKNLLDNKDILNSKTMLQYSSLNYSLV